MEVGLTQVEVEVAAGQAVGLKVEVEGTPHCQRAMEAGAGSPAG